MINSIALTLTLWLLTYIHTCHGSSVKSMFNKAALRSYPVFSQACVQVGIHDDTESGIVCCLAADAGDCSHVFRGLPKTATTEMRIDISSDDMLHSIVLMRSDILHGIPMISFDSVSRQVSDGSQVDCEEWVDNIGFPTSPLDLLQWNARFPDSSFAIFSHSVPTVVCNHQQRLRRNMRENVRRNEAPTQHSQVTFTHVAAPFIALSLVSLIMLQVARNRRAVSSWVGEGNRVIIEEKSFTEKYCSCFRRKQGQPSSASDTTVVVNPQLTKSGPGSRPPSGGGILPTAAHFPQEDPLRGTRATMRAMAASSKPVSSSPQQTSGNAYARQGPVAPPAMGGAVSAKEWIAARRANRGVGALPARGGAASNATTDGPPSPAPGMSSRHLAIMKAQASTRHAVSHPAQPVRKPMPGPGAVAPGGGVGAGGHPQPRIVKRIGRSVPRGALEENEMDTTIEMTSPSLRTATPAKHHGGTLRTLTPVTST